MISLDLYLGVHAAGLASPEAFPLAVDRAYRLAGTFQAAFLEAPSLREAYQEAHEAAYPEVPCPAVPFLEVALVVAFLAVAHEMEIFPGVVHEVEVVSTAGPYLVEPYLVEPCLVEPFLAEVLAAEASLEVLELAKTDHRAVALAYPEVGLVAGLCPQVVAFLTFGTIVLVRLAS